MSNAAVAVGRVLLGLYFLLPGLIKAASPEQTLAYMQSHDIPLTAGLMWFSTAVNILGGLALIFDRHVKLVAVGFIIYVLLVNLMLHDFWTMDETMVDRERQNFFKNLGILAGLLVLAGQASSRTLSLQGWWKSDRAIAQQA